VKVWGAETGHELLAVPAKVEGPLAFSADGHRLIALGDPPGPDGNPVRVFDATPLPDDPPAPPPPRQAR
jgi:hypothetical protein